MKRLGHSIVRRHEAASDEVDQGLVMLDKLRFQTSDGDCDPIVAESEVDGVGVDLCNRTLAKVNASIRLEGFDRSVSTDHDDIDFEVMHATSNLGETSSCGDAENIYSVFSDAQTKLIYENVDTRPPQEKKSDMRSIGGIPSSFEVGNTDSVYENVRANGGTENSPGGIHDAAVGIVNRNDARSDSGGASNTAARIIGTQLMQTGGQYAKGSLNARGYLNTYQDSSSLHAPTTHSSPMHSVSDGHAGSSTEIADASNAAIRMTGKLQRQSVSTGTALQSKLIIIDGFEIEYEDASSGGSDDASSGDSDDASSGDSGDEDGYDYGELVHRCREDYERLLTGIGRPVRSYPSESSGTDCCVYDEPVVSTNGITSLGSEGSADETNLISSNYGNLLDRTITHRTNERRRLVKQFTKELSVDIDENDDVTGGVTQTQSAAEPVYSIFRAPAVNIPGSRQYEYEDLLDAHERLKFAIFAAEAALESKRAKTAAQGSRKLIYSEIDVSGTEKCVFGQIVFA